MTASFAAGTPLWEPSEEVKQKANVTQYIQWLAREKGLTFQIYEELWEWSLSHLEDFYQYGGKPFDRLPIVAELQQLLPGLQKTVLVPSLKKDAGTEGLCNTVFWQYVLKGKYA